ncbi:major facilitator superfamily domain-containing protein [Paramyrothecium foliicola]|nr:major facilitator superfamily domain-containing protein [Paramyrothecium foliicola]
MNAPGKSSLEIGVPDTQVDIAPTETIQIGPSTDVGDQEGQEPWSKQLIRKIDWHLMPLMCASYMIQFLDKQTLGQASIMGIIEDLKLTGNQFSWTGSIFYIGYLAALYPASVLMVKFPIGKFIAATFLAWGIILACHAATHNFPGLMATRFLLGATEASVSPGFSLITAMWYRREEQPLRHGLWFSGNSLAAMFGGLFAYGIAHIEGSIPAWKWLFIIYAIITIFFAVLLGFFLPDQPATARFLSDDERDSAIMRIKGNQTGAVKHEIQWNQVWEALTDVNAWLMFFIQLTSNIPNGGITTFGNMVIEGFGFSTLQVYLLNIPLGALLAISAIGGTYLAGKLQRSRCLITAGLTTLSLIGMLMVYYVDNRGAQLAGYYSFVFSAAGMPITLSMISSNVGGYTKRSAISAMIFMAYCIGNVTGPFLFFSHEAPKYRSGFLSIVICLATCVALLLILALSWTLENTRRDRRYGALPQMGAIDKSSSKEEINVAFNEDLTDRQNHNFRYDSFFAMPDFFSQCMTQIIVDAVFQDVRLPQAAKCPIQTTFLITEDDKWEEEPYIYAKVYEEVLVLIDTGCGGASRDATAQLTSLRKFIETYPVHDNGNVPLNSDGAKSYVIICSHCHYDHIGGIAQFTASPNHSVWASSFNRDFVEGKDRLPTSSLCRFVGMETPNYKVTHWADDGQRLVTNSGEDLGLTIFQTPGHTPDELAIWDAQERVLFVGDTLYERGHIFFPPEGNLKLYSETLTRLRSLVTTWNDESFDALNIDRINGAGVEARVKIAGGHITCGADAEQLISNVQGFFYQIAKGEIEALERELLFDDDYVAFYRPDGAIKFLMPKKLLDEYKA